MLNLIKHKITIIKDWINTKIDKNMKYHIFLIVDFIFFFIIKRTVFLKKYYNRNNNIWNDGFLFDFLQKKTIDSWIRNYVILTGFLFSERLVFDSIIRLYTDLVFNKLHNISFYEPSNASSMIAYITYFYLFMLFSIFIVYPLFFF